MSDGLPVELKAVLDVLRETGVVHALIGGWAVVAWGVVRASEDVDVLIELPTSRRKALLAALSRAFDAEWRQGEPGDPVPGLIRAQPKSGGLPVDLLPARSNADIAALDRAKSVAVGALRIPIVTPEDLIAMKLEAGGGQDYEDVRRLLRVIADDLDQSQLKASCDARRVSDRLASLTKS